MLKYRCEAVDWMRLIQQSKVNIRETGNYFGLVSGMLDSQERMFFVVLLKSKISNCLTFSKLILVTLQTAVQCSVLQKVVQ
jgi:hypothetical protein